ncbi:hypothetical protein L915_02985 [Phytophthora nicotianae]|uniref:Uncharacterized protein n=2 Tax=Phytophthora nicotianae TaxID=4792 RepID=W2P9L6_PHYN3|nr:hypothetical protein PPTG_24930 [Phytophthora nicotianae INRA-310]ETK93889.1 hypothetical protein L915_02985 [Phytophthora nicotianae]ETM97516.1 hypothetical protein PPTG_24930 [Phytophthora nicotianae INRA-310]
MMMDIINRKIYKNVIKYTDAYVVIDDTKWDHILIKE